MPLRSNFEPGTSRWATRRAQWRALGLTDEDMVKPKIAIVNSSSQLAICFSHLDEIARRARRAVERAGRRGLRGAHRGAERLHHQRRAPRRVHPVRPRPDHQRHRGRGGRRAPGRHALPGLLRQDRTRPADGRRQAEHPVGHRRLRLPAERDLPGPALRHRGRVPGRRARRQRQAHRGRTDRDERARRARPRRVRGHGHGQHHAPGLRGARHGAAGHHPGPGQQRADVAGGRAGRAPRGRDDGRGPAAARHPHPGRLRQRGDGHLVGQRLDQLGQAPAGGRGRSRVRRGRVPDVRGAGRPGAAAGRGPAQRRGADRGVRGRRRRPRRDEAARAAAGRPAR